MATRTTRTLLSRATTSTWEHHSLILIAHRVRTRHQTTRTSVAETTRAQERHSRTPTPHPARTSRRTIRALMVATTRTGVLRIHRIPARGRHQPLGLVNSHLRHSLPCLPHRHGSNSLADRRENITITNGSHPIRHASTQIVRWSLRATSAVLAERLVFVPAGILTV